MATVNGMVFNREKVYCIIECIPLLIALEYDILQVMPKIRPGQAQRPKYRPGYLIV